MIEYKRQNSQLLSNIIQLQNRFKISFVFWWISADWNQQANWNLQRIENKNRTPVSVSCKAAFFSPRDLVSNAAALFKTQWVERSRPLAEWHLSDSVALFPCAVVLVRVQFKCPDVLYNQFQSFWQEAWLRLRLSFQENDSQRLKVLTAESITLKLMLTTNRYFSFNDSIAKLYCSFIRVQLRSLSKLHKNKSQWLVWFPIS